MTAGGIFTTLEPGQPDLAEPFERLFGTPTGTDLSALSLATASRTRADSEAAWRRRWNPAPRHTSRRGGDPARDPSSRARPLQAMANAALG